MTPWNTGKVKIGLTHRPRRVADFTEEEVLAQQLLLGIKPQRRSRRWTVVICLAAALYAAAVFAFWRQA